MSFPPAKTLDNEAIADRVRAVVQRQPGHCLAVVADSLGVARDAFCRVVQERGRVVETSLLIDVVTALVYEIGIDPQWLLTGEYDPTVHREALLIGEDRSAEGIGALRYFVFTQYRELENRAMFFGFLSLKKRKHRQYAGRS